MTNKIEITRELLEDLLGSAQAEAIDRRAALGDFRPLVQAELDRVVNETKALLAAPAVERQEPVAWCNKSNLEALKEKGYCQIWLGKLTSMDEPIGIYTEQSAPVAVVLPERKNQTTNYVDAYARGWNACLNKVKELNQPATITGFKVVEDPSVPFGAMPVCNCNQGRLPCTCKA